MDNDDLIDILAYTPMRLEYPFAWVGHLPFAYYLTKKMSPGVIVELGTHKGNSLCAFAEGAKCADTHSLIYGIDSWEGDPHANYSGGCDIYDELKEFVSKEYSNIVLVRANFADVLNQFEDESIDILHIDGFHSYEAVKRDFETWLPKVKLDGVILLHDIEVEREGFGAKELWAEIQSKYQTFAFTHSHGLGIVLMEKSVRRKAVRELMNDYNGSTLIYRLLEMKGLALLHKCEKSSEEYIAKYIRKISVPKLSKHIPVRRMLKAIVLRARWLWAGVDKYES